MKRKFGALKWDFIVSLLVVACGFAFAVGRVIHPNKRSAVNPFSSVKGSLASTESLADDVFDLGCVDRLEGAAAFAISGGIVRIRGQLCDSLAPQFVEKLTVRNLTNGYEGTVFQKKNATFSTSRMALAQGKNVIVILWKPGENLPNERVMAEVYNQK